MMAKVILEFDAFEERQAIEHAMRGAEYYAALQEIERFLRSKVKHSDMDDKLIAYEEIRTELYSILEEIRLDR